MSEQNSLDWSVLPLESFIGCDTLFSDGDWVESKDQDAEGTNRLIQLADVGDGSFLDKSDRNMNDEQFNRLRCTELLEGDILIARMPDPLGRACLFPLTDQRCATVVDVAILRSPKADRDWLLYSLNSPQSRRQIATLSAGTTRVRISRNLLAKVCFPTPRREVQETIASILRLIDINIEKTEALIEKYQQIKAGLMHDLFTRGIGDDGKLRPPREEAPEVYQETAIGWIPWEWQLKSLGDVAANAKNSTVIGPFGSDLVMNDYRNEGIPVIFVRDVKEDYFNWVSNVFVSKSKAMQLIAHRVDADDILATKMGLPPCVSCVYPEHSSMGIITADMIRMTANTSKVNPRWLSAAINHDRVKRQVSAITAGVTRPKITLKDFRNLKIALPSKSEQLLVLSLLKLQNRRIDDEKRIRVKLEKQKTGLMQDLLTGKVQVNIPTPEQAAT